MARYRVGCTGAVRAHSSLEHPGGVRLTAPGFPAWKPRHACGVALPLDGMQRGVLPGRWLDIASACGHLHPPMPSTFPEGPYNDADTARLDILVEAMGRRNFGCEEGGWDLKGLQSSLVTLNGESAGAKHAPRETGGEGWWQTCILPGPGWGRPRLHLLNRSRNPLGCAPPKRCSSPSNFGLSRSGARSGSFLI